MAASSSRGTATGATSAAWVRSGENSQGYRRVQYSARAHGPAQEVVKG